MPAPPLIAGPSAGNAALAATRAARPVFAAAALFLVLLWSFVAYWTVGARQEAVTGAERILRGLNHAAEEQTRRLFRTVDLFLGVADQWIADNPQRDPRSDAGFQRLIDDFRRRSGNAVDIRLAAGDGTLLPRSAGERPLGDDDFFRAAVGGDLRHFHVGAPQASGPNGVWQIPVAHRLTQGRPDAAALVATVELSALLSLYEEVRMRPNGAVALMRRDGVLLARTPHDERLIGRSMAGGELYRELLPRAERGFGHIARATTDAQEKYVGYAALGDLPLVLAVSIPADDVLGQWRRQALIVALLAGGVSAAALLLASRLARARVELATRDAELQRLATTDPTTGAYNRHHFLSLLYREFARDRRHDTLLSLMVVDLDFFKQINDGYGHAVGDEALRALVRTAARCLREMDAIGRLGGEEFAVLLPGTRAEQAEIVAERIRGAVAGIAIETEHGTVRFTVSVGVTQGAADDASVDALLARADAALHTAKASGRNRVVVRAAGERHGRS